MTIRFPSGDRHYTFVDRLPSVGESFYAAGEDWIVANAREASDGSAEIFLARSDVVGHSEVKSERTQATD